MKNIKTLLFAVLITLLVHPAFTLASNLGDTLGAFNAGILTPTPDRALRGIEFADGHFWISGLDPASGWQRKLYKISADGQNLVQYWTYSSMSESWFDLAYDGQFLYGVGIDSIYQIDMTSGQRTGLQFNSPYYYNGGLTYDPANDNFWVSGDGNLIHNINREGTILKSISFIQDLPAAGLAWDTWSEGGPFLWVWSMLYTSTDVRPKAYQINPVNGQFTGVTFLGETMNPFGIDGAISFTLTDQLIPGKTAFAALQSSNYATPHDQMAWVVLYDLNPEGAGVPGPQISVSPNNIQNDLLPNDSIDVPVYIGNLSEFWDLNWQATLEYPNFLPSDPGEVLLSFDVTELTAPDFDKTMRSIVFLNDYIYISTSIGFNNAYYLYKISKDGIEIISKTMVGGGFGSGGWTAITTDGEYLYAATTYFIAQVDPNTLQVITIIPKYNFSVTSMAIDSQNDNFYLAGGNVIKKINKAGDQLNFYTLPHNIQGLAWDSWSPGSPYLWVYHKTGGPDAPIMAVRLNPETGNTTNFDFEGVNLSIDSTYSDAPMDIFVTPDWQQNKMVMLALHNSFGNSGQGAKKVVAYDMGLIPPPRWIRLLTPSSGNTSPQDNDTLYVRLKAIMQDTLMVAKVVINSNDVLNPRYIVPVNFRMLPQSIASGDANCDGTVNILDVIATVSYLVGQNPAPFCPENADINGDGLINIVDVIAIVNLATGTKNAFGSLSGNTPAHIILNQENITLKSDGNISGLQFELYGLNNEMPEFIFPGYEFAGNFVNGRFFGIIFSKDNSPLPSGEITIFKLNKNQNLKWGEVIAVNPFATEVPVSKSLTEELFISVFPNPSKGLFSAEIKIPEQVEATIRVFDMQGRVVKTLFQGILNEGHHRFDAGTILKSGIYLLRAETVSGTQEVILKSTRLIVTG
jgi:hypothetical protein